jgi:cytidylate kinase
MNRKAAPLKPASDAIIIDTTTLDINQVTNEVMSLVDQRVRLS